MATHSIDVPLPPELGEYLSKPICIPMPKPGKAQITLPSGGSLKGVVDITKGIPDDCSLSFSLVLQLAPMLASIECLLKVLKLLKPLIDVVNGLPTPPVKALKDFAEAAVDLAPCLAIPTPVAMIPFVRDILCLIIKLLSCIVAQLKSIMSVLGGLSLQIQSAQAAGNSELLASLQCAQRNAQTSAQHMVSAIDPVLVLLSLAEPMLGIAGVKPIQTPAIAAPQDLEAMQGIVNTLDELVKTLKLAAEVVGGC